MSELLRRQLGRSSPIVGHGTGTADVTAGICVGAIANVSYLVVLEWTLEGIAVLIHNRYWWPASVMEHNLVEGAGRRHATHLTALHEHKHPIHK